MIEQPYRDSGGKEPLRDTGRNPRIPDEQQHMSGARVFDTLAPTLVTLVRIIRTGIWALAAFIIFIGASMVYSTIALRNGQAETRELIIALSRHNCAESAPHTLKEK